MAKWNGFIRSFREDILNCYLFESLDEVREMAWEWQIEYNEQRCHDSLHNLTPVEYRLRYAAQLAELSTNGCSVFRKGYTWSIS